MPPLDKHSSGEIVKLLLLGDAGAGKTGALESLLALDLKLRIWDYDNLLGSLRSYAKRNHPDKLSNISYATLTDVPGKQPTAYTRGKNLLLNGWKIDDEDLGQPGEWGADTVIVIDSLSALAQSAFIWAKAMDPNNKDGRAAYQVAQSLVRDLLVILKSDAVKCNVIVIAHLDYDKNHLGVTKGFPRTVGSAQYTEIGMYFNAILLSETTGLPPKHVIRTTGNGIIELKNPVAAPKLPDTLPLETGLADFFKAVRAQ